MIIGAGYVGLTLAAILADCGHVILCVDSDKKRINLLKNNTLPIFEPGLDSILFNSFIKKNISFSSEIPRDMKHSIVYLCIGASLNVLGRIDVSTIFSVLDIIFLCEQPPDLICIKSTLPPGTMRSIRQFMTEKKSLSSLVYHPEFMREGSAISDITDRNPLVLGSDSSKAMDQIESLYIPMLKKKELQIIKTSFETAELIKFGWNGFSALRITYFNELSRLCDQMDGDQAVMLRGIAQSERLLPTDQIKPGCGFGGSCLPKDTLSFSKIFEDFGIFSSLIHQTISSNEEHKKFIIDLILNSLGNPVAGKTVSILGCSFKANTDDIRHSIALPIIERLINEGALIRAYDPICLDQIKRFFPHVDCFECPYNAIEQTDCIIVLTDSPEIKQISLDRAKFLARGNLIIDPGAVLNYQNAIEKGFRVIRLKREEHNSPTFEREPCGLSK